MAPLKKESTDAWCSYCSTKMRFASLIVMLTGPFFLAFLNIRCEKNQCVLLQFPLVLPTHLSAYFSSFSAAILGFFFLFMFIASILSQNDQKKGKFKDSYFSPALSSTLLCLLALSGLMAATAYLKPDYIHSLRAEYLRLLCAVIVFSVIFSLALTIMCKVKYLRKERDHCLPMGFFHGFNTKVRVAKVDLKYFFYVNVGLVAWGLLDLLIFISYVLDHPVTAPLLFIFTTQYLFIMHTLLYEKSLSERPFMYKSGLGFFWLLKVLLYMPFLFSLPVLYTSVTEITIAKPAMLANCGLFMFGFLIYVSSLHQRESFSANPSSYRMKSTVTHSGRRLLIGGYWGTIQKPDYLGYLIMWISWTAACGFSTMSVMVLLIVIATVISWLYEREIYHKERYGSAWGRYTSLVPHKIIPFLY